MRSRVNGYVERIRTELRKSFTQDHTPREVAGSFALGVFITMLPTLGVGVLVFIVLAYLFERLNKIALFASVLVLNPVVKWGVYAASISLGFFLLGPVEGFDGGAVSLDDGLEVLIRLWVGNLILAAIATVIAYPLAYRMVTGYRDRELDVVGTTIETVVESFDELKSDASTDEPETLDGSFSTDAETAPGESSETTTGDQRTDPDTTRSNSDTTDRT